MWTVRTLPSVRAAFAALWNTQDLLVSFDGGGAFRPTHTRPDLRTMGGWWHCDQNCRNPGRQGRVCVQGLVTLTVANEWTGGLCVVPGSHKHHDAYCRRHPLAKHQGDFLPVPAGDPILEAGGVLVCAEAGDLVLWDSRTIHCNTPGLRPAADAPAGKVPAADELLRLVGYVCMTPAKWCPVDVLAKRAEAAQEFCSTTHWPHAFVPRPAPPWMDWRRSPAEYSWDQARLIVGDKRARAWIGAEDADERRLCAIA